MLQIDLGMFDEARVEIAQLRSLSRLGVFETTASQLEERLESARQASTKDPESRAVNAPGQ